MSGTANLAAPAPVILRADATAAMGTGHAMRCMALAAYLSELGLRPILAGRILVPWVRERLRLEGIPFVELPGEPPRQESPESLLASLKAAASSGTKSFGKGGDEKSASITHPAAWVILDGYHFGPDCHQAVRARGYKLLVIDDGNHLPEYHADILLNQNPGAASLPYRGEIGQALLGPRFALLRREFAEARPLAERSPVPETVRHILLSLGGGNFAEKLREMAPVLSSPLLAGKTLRVLLGSMPEGEVRDILGKTPAILELYGRVDDMPGLLLEVDACITAGGSTCWELCCLGIPFCTVSVAENQNPVVEELALAGYAPRFGQEGLETLLRDAPHFRERLLAFVDGRGARRVAAAMVRDEMLLRPAEKRDKDAVYAVANDPTVRAMSFSTNSISSCEHEAWFAARLARSRDNPFFVACYADRVVGYAGLDTADERFSVSLALAEAWRGGGLGRTLLRRLLEAGRLAAPGKAVFAWCRESNRASLALFHQAGFRESPDSTRPGFFLLHYDPGADTRKAEGRL